ncbi:NUDIX hydrolase [bacterium (Candidatus Blackallbacteria) CG17_big_fil_post_rev_8_21_14_2_50_48_46]|uniref:NUDIX hydrolase n=1 Tax=bacterium (Candidatus Blackallbacteria) CG17_big_fil_post_rev_8_21_14_2_50_48_46 TaxID=2014261 RepID=A0A2M7G8H8_9BACT|nr:MAG: NUDIX hydrolase [bacterium (Candidatus Blackallbacteria) CG18_big_fil_WC_8_21_14_2_50_49_26]PIW18413.1 MAG: NUDIX hydrolase [bacterium (Candidatus Blackallbacteria) CG17_big_fil_post_rev_8_21_14_2_50_48_46]PIW50572.1 MAG: NUDIX hydrolase [bacterium (Candidatus Blackallbacteria) CG13_big_fil_rev_8_21_14_2_50_49_14]
MPPIQYCSHCAAPVQRRIPQGDNRERIVCTACTTVHYQNPQIVVGCVAFAEEGYLLCQRAIEPRSGFWTIPGGYLELNESTEEGALREAHEEAGAKLNILSLLAVYSLTHISQVQILYLAKMQTLNLCAGEESLQVKIFPWQKIPWDSLAFPSNYWALHHAQAMRKNPALTPDLRSGNSLLPPGSALDY